MMIVIHTVSTSTAAIVQPIPVYITGLLLSTTNAVNLGATMSGLIVLAETGHREGYPHPLSAQTDNLTMA